MQQQKTEILPQKPEKTWSISIYSGDSPLNLTPKKDIPVPAITCDAVTDISATFVADPFMIRVDNVWYLFMEIMNGATGLGEIGLVTSIDGLIWEYQCVVLKEKYHLSYPFAFKYRDEYFMVPETLGANAVRLYKAVNFPYNWEFECNLTEGQYADPTLFYHNGLWWMFASRFPKANENLNLFYSENLNGPFIPHAQNPLVEKDNRHARPAGRINFNDGHLIRLCQDCIPVYGSRVRAFEITELTTTTYAERELPQSPVLYGSESNKQWNSRGMHHMDAHQIENGKWLACVDGCYYDKPNIKKRAVWIFDDNFKVPTFLSVASFREQMDVPVTLFFLGNHEQELMDTFKRLGGEIEFIADNDSRQVAMKQIDRHKKNRFMRMKIMEMWPQEVVILFDGDTAFSEKIAGLNYLIDRNFQNADLNQSLVGGVLDGSGLPDFFTATRDEHNRLVQTSESDVVKTICDVYGDNWEQRMGSGGFNNGVLILYNCVELAKAWKMHYLKGIEHPKVNPEDDQLPLTIAIDDLKIPVMAIDSVFNSTGRLSGDYAIFHAYNNKWKSELTKIENDEKDLEDFGIIARKHIHKIPSHWLEILFGLNELSSTDTYLRLQKK